jgi:hypothetical protein
MRAHEIFEANEPKFINATYTDRPSLKKAIYSVWGESDHESKLVQSKGSKMGFTLGVYHIIDQQGNVVGMWETTDASNVAGRGAVTYGFGKVAEKPKGTSANKQEEPVRAGEPTAKATPEEISKATSELLSAFKQTANRYSEFRSSSDSFEVRDWGSWENPEGEEDEEDYDWQVLTHESGQQIKQIVSKIQAKYPNVKFDITTEEKNWIYARMGSKL